MEQKPLTVIEFDKTEIFRPSFVHHLQTGLKRYTMDANKTDKFQLIVCPVVGDDKMSFNDIIDEYLASFPQPDEIDEKLLGQSPDQVIENVEYWWKHFILSELGETKGDNENELEETETPS